MSERPRFFSGPADKPDAAGGEEVGGASNEALSQEALSEMTAAINKLPAAVQPIANYAFSEVQRAASEIQKQTNNLIAGVATGNEFYGWDKNMIDAASKFRAGNKDTLRDKN